MGLFGFGSVQKLHLEWEILSDESSIEDLIKSSFEIPVLLFKHSTRCSVSYMALENFEKEWSLEVDKCKIYYLDLLKYRGVSNQIAEMTGIQHQSPQAIVLSKGHVIYHASHSAISAQAIKQLLS